MEKQQINSKAIFSQFTTGSQHRKTNSCPNEIQIEPAGYICIAQIFTIFFNRGKYYKQCQEKKDFCPVFKTPLT